jgi:hypothetical protein
MSHMMLIMDAQRKPEPSRTVETVEAQLRSMLAAGALDLPRPGGGATAQRWPALAGLGRRDLALARLAERHSNAVTVLAEAGRVAVPGAALRRVGGTVPRHRSQDQHRNRNVR